MSRRSVSEWSAILGEFAVSGQSQSGFASERGIPLGSFHYQLARQRRLTRAAPPTSRAFVEVSRVASTVDSALQVEIRVGEQVCVCASSWPSPAWLLALADARPSGRC